MTRTEALNGYHYQAWKPEPARSGYSGVCAATIRYYDRGGTLTPKELLVDRFGAFGVGHPVTADGIEIERSYTIYHLPTRLMLLPWACRYPSHTLDIAHALVARQYHARAWMSNSPARLRHDRRVKVTINEVWFTDPLTAMCEYCRTLTELDIYP